MWVSESNKWTKNTTSLERFLTERIIQRCDYDEILSNQHRTTNGYTQLKELVNLCVLSISRGRTIRTVIILFEESKSNLFSQNIVNDSIVENYFSDLKYFIKNYNTSTLITKDKEPNLVELQKLTHQLKIFESQLEKGYFSAIKKEFHSIDYKLESKFERSAKRISILIDILIPYLVFKGYAVSSLSEVLYSWIEKNYKISVGRVFSFFNFQKRSSDYLIKLDDNLGEEVKTFLDLLEEDIDTKITQDLVENLKTKDDALEIIFKDKERVAIYNHKDLDPHIHFRSIYDSLLKRVVQKRERQSLAAFNNFFACCYWKVPKKNKFYHNVSLVNDPINVNFRGRTLRDTLIISSKDYDFNFTEKDNIPVPKNNQLNSSVYYYNLALGSKSIENSLSLLWTSIESLLPYRTHYSDVDCVQNFISKSLSLGSVSRDINSFAKRFVETNNKNNSVFNAFEFNDLVHSTTKESIQDWYNWIVNQENHEAKFKLVKDTSELLAFEYSRIGKPLTDGKLKDFKNRIQTSHDSIKYQIQRIYLHRNQIIHAGNLVNEYTNLWMHLEWYVGKLLAYSIINIEIKETTNSLEDLFIEVEADYDFVMSYLEKNLNKSVSEMSDRLKGIVLNYSWQSF